MKSEEILKEKFTKICKFVEPSGNGLICLFDNIEHDDDHISISRDPDYPMLKEKMTKILDLVNNDLSLLDKDLEEELWYMV